VVTGGKDGSLQICDPVTGQCVATLKNGNREIKSIAVLNAPVQAPLALTEKELCTRAEAAGATPEQLEVAVDSKNPKTVLVSLVTELETAGESAQGTAMLVSGSEDGMLRLWDPQTQTCVSTFKGHTEQVNCVAVLKDTREHPSRAGKDIVVSGASDNTIKLWNIWAEHVGARMGDDYMTTSVAVLTGG
jgi:WD40 repeat protein